MWIFSYIGTTSNATCVDNAFSDSAVIDCPDGLLYDDSLFSTTAVEDFSMSCENSFKKSLSQVHMEFL